ncbi:MAG: hypothetical protein KJ792_06615 [Actinobacteria bacterium]|nr:hypothetical protein [Actinomycetota bacterium]MCG2802893.1 hypothetical protein [Cellulomonas sp.]
MPLASSLTNLIPSDDLQGFMRRIEALESDARGVPALVQQMVGPQIAKITTAQADLAAAQAALDAQQDYLESLVTRDASAPSFNTGTLTADSADHWVGTPATLSIACPTGKLRIVMSCAEASIAPGSGAGGVIAMLSFSIGTAVDIGDYDARLYSAGSRIGASLSRVKTITVDPGTYTVTAQAGYWCSGFSAASINFGALDLSAEVVNGA